MTPRLAHRSHPVDAERGPRSRAVLAVAAIGALAAMALAVLAPLFARPAHVPELGVQNSSEWHTTVAVAGEDGGGWVGLGRVIRDEERTFHEVLDQGDVWTVRFTYAGTTAQVVVTRAELEQQGWVVEVPPTFAAALEGAGRPPSDDDG
jgi:hypothetical protein